MDPAVHLQQAIYAALTRDPGVVALIDDRVFDKVPEKESLRFPYVTIGECHVIDDSADEYQGTECILTLHAWTRDSDAAADFGFIATKRLAAAIRAALDRQALDLDVREQSGQRLIDFQYQDTRCLNDPDGLTKHGVITFRALTEPV